MDRVEAADIQVSLFGCSSCFDFVVSKSLNDGSMSKTSGEIFIQISFKQLSNEEAKSVFYHSQLKFILKK